MAGASYQEVFGLDGRRSGCERGGGALIGTARIMCTLFNMTEDEAKLLQYSG